MRVLLSLLLFMAAAGAAIAGDVICNGCGRKITGRHIKTGDGRRFCGKRCYLKHQPKCADCGKPITGRHFNFKGKKYCSRKCVEKQLPQCALCGKHTRTGKKRLGKIFCERCAALPKCYECGMPVRGGKRLADGRHLCRDCWPEAVLDRSQANTVYARGRAELKRITGLQTSPAPKLLLANADEINRFYEERTGKAVEGHMRGYFRRREHYIIREDAQGNRERVDERVEREIYLLRGAVETNMFVTAVHESTHDLMARTFPATLEAPLWVQEGIAQYIAAIAARRHKLKLPLTIIETHPDESYGGGYRYFKKTFGQNNWKGLHAWLRKTDLTKLPERCPEK